jgi:Zn-dependent protease
MLFNLTLPTIITRIITLMIAFTFHEFAHAATATALGDTTPKYHGRLTLNPFAHLDIMGTIMLLVAGFGWAKPVPVNPYAVKRKTKAGMMLVSLAGPTTNLLLGLLAAIPLRFGWVPYRPTTSAFLPTLSDFLLNFLMINLVLFLFNLLPLAPLDGEKVITYFLPPKGVDFFERIRPYSAYILLAIVLILPMLGLDILEIIIWRPMTSFARFLLGWN